MIEEHVFNSSLISKAKYDNKELLLTIYFKTNSKSYEFYNVPVPTWIAFKNSDSPGRFFNSTLKKKFNATTLADRRK